MLADEANMATMITAKYISGDKFLYAEFSHFVYTL
jgi:hypothetical protein